MTDNEKRARRFYALLASYGGPSDLPDKLVDVLTDAMHWCHSSRVNFHFAFAQACRHYLHELNNQQTDERRLA